MIDLERIVVVSREGIDHEARSKTGAEWLKPAGLNQSALGAYW